MKTLKVFSAFMIAAVLVALSAPGIAMAGAYESTWASTIAYQNIGSGTATVYIAFYENAGDTSPDTYPAGTIAKDASEVIIVGDLIGGTFKGSAVLSADQPLTAVIVQVAGDTTVRVRPVSNGFSTGDVQTIIPTSYKKAAVKTQFAVQNIGPGQATAQIKFLNLDGTLRYQYSQIIEAGAAHFVDLATISDVNIPADWTGAIDIDRTAGTGMLVSSAMELNTNSAAYPNRAYSFEGVNGGSLLLYMPSAMCQGGSPATTSFYAIQNPNASQANVTVTFQWNDGTSTTKTLTLLGNQKGSVTGCDVDAGPQPLVKNGSAIIQSTNGVSIIAMGKVANSNFATAFNGIPSGSAKVSLPFIRYANTTYYNTGQYQRTFITIQNVSGFTVNAGQVLVKYIDRDGAVLGTHTLDQLLDGGKQSSSPPQATPSLTEFGYYSSYTQSGGGVIVECSAVNCKLAVVVRVAAYISTGSASEDYVGIAIP